MGDLLFEDMLYVKGQAAEVQKADPYYTSCFLSGEEITIQFLADGSVISNPPFSNDQMEFSIFTTDQAHVGSHNIVVVASVGTPVQLTNNLQTFVASINGCCLAEPTSGDILEDLTYNIQSSGAQSLSFDDFTLSSLLPAAAPLTYTTSTLPSFVTFNSNTRMFVVDSNDNAHALLSPYTIEVYAEDADGVIVDPASPVSF